MTYTILNIELCQQLSITNKLNIMLRRHVHLLTSPSSSSLLGCWVAGKDRRRLIQEEVRAVCHPDGGDVTARCMDEMGTGSGLQDLLV